MAVHENYKRELLGIIHAYLPSCKVLLFGSRATGKQHPGSDIDLALDNGGKIPWSTITRILLGVLNAKHDQLLQALSTLDESIFYGVILRVER